MAIVLGNSQPLSEQINFSAQPLKWVGQTLTQLFTGSRHNPSPLPERVWSRHSALLESARKHSQQKKD